MQPRHDKFIKVLRGLKSKFPEFAEILEYLIQHVEEDKKRKLQDELKKLNRDKW